MLVLITYDVNTTDAAGKRRLRNVAKLCVCLLYTSDAADDASSV